MCRACGWEEALDIAEEILTLSERLRDEDDAEKIQKSVDRLAEDIDYEEHVSQSQKRRLRKMLSQVEEQV